MYQALYRAYRPEVFDEILGQDHIVRILRHQLESDKVGHAYLLCGTRGTGKTTTARILAKGVNCLSEGARPCGTCASCRAIKDGTFIDVIEIDAASNNGVENIRELRESVKYPPAIGRKKVYIIDEVHMLSAGAFNALLKTLEEPPEHVMFILATTEPQKLPATILSRCMRLDFRRVSENLLKKGMREICTERGIAISDAALGIIAVNADGSVRDCLSILDQCLSGGKTEIVRDDVLELLGTPAEEVFIELTHHVAIHDTAEALVILNQVLAEGKEVRQLMKDWLAHYRALLIAKYIASPEDMLNISEENAARIRSQADTLGVSEISTCIMELSRAIADAKWSTQPRILLELAIVKMSSIYEEMQKVPVRVMNPAPKEKKAEPEKKQEEVPAAKKEEKPAAEDAVAELEKLRRNLIVQAAADQPSLMMMRTSCSITEVKGDTFVVESCNSAVLELLGNSRENMESKAEKIVGRPMVMKLKDNQETAVQTKTQAEELAKEAESVLGLNVALE